jgi:hypothetical protein
VYTDIIFIQHFSLLIQKESLEIFVYFKILIPLTIWRLTATLWSYRTAKLQMLHFLFIQQLYVLNILNMLHTLRFFLFKMSFIS